MRRRSAVAKLDHVGVKQKLVLAAVIAAWASSAGWVQAEEAGQEQGPSAECRRLEHLRTAAAGRADGASLGALSRQYVERCRMIREKEAVAIAMGDRATAARLMKQWLQALDLAQGCINFHYAAIICHAEKARALAAMRMGRSASEVIATGYGVAGRAQEAAEHEIRVARGNRGALKSDDYSTRMAMARWRLALVAEGRAELAKAEKDVERVVSVQRSN